MPPQDNASSDNPQSDAVQTPAPQVPAAAAPVSVSSPAVSVDEWERKYKGLQGLQSRTASERDKALGDLAALQVKIEEYTLKVTDLEGKIAALTSSVNVKDRDIETAKGDAQAKALEVERLKLIVSEFPQLAPFEASGVLPSASTVEEMRTKFGAFQTAMTSIVGEGVRTSLRGASIPATSPASSQASIDDLYEKMSKIAGVRGKEEEFRSLQKQYDALRELPQSITR